MHISRVTSSHPLPQTTPLLQHSKDKLDTIGLKLFLYLAIRLSFSQLRQKACSLHNQGVPVTHTPIWQRLVVAGPAVASPFFVFSL